MTAPPITTHTAGPCSICDGISHGYTVVAPLGAVHPHGIVAVCPECAGAPPLYSSVEDVSPNRRWANVSERVVEARDAWVRSLLVVEQLDAVRSVFKLGGHAALAEHRRIWMQVHVSVTFDTGNAMSIETRDAVELTDLDVPHDPDDIVTVADVSQPTSPRSANSSTRCRRDEV